MNLIISEHEDPNTNLVIEWLLSKDILFNRLNHKNTTESLSYKLSNKNQEIIIDNNIPKKIWHRRGRFSFLSLQKSKSKAIYNYLRKEEDSVVKSLEITLKENIDYVGSYLKETENYKITHLELAKKAGFNIPDSLITTSKKDLVEFYNLHKQIITKDIRYPVYIETKDEILSSTGVKMVDDRMIDNLSSNFAPIFVQEYIPKKFELRIFYFNEKIYPMAIFSQSNEKTKIDFRNYDYNKPNKCVPFNLNSDLQKKLIKFAKATNLDTGSIDMIYNNDNELFFLEVNPQGQFDSVSKNCNYYIEKDIADFFIS